MFNKKDKMTNDIDLAKLFTPTRYQNIQDANSTLFRFLVEYIRINPNKKLEEIKVIDLIEDLIKQGIEERQKECEGRQ